MWRAVKDKASASRRRYRKDDFDLDLSYITDRIIAMGIPASGVETAYRNSAVDVARFLHKYHSHRFVVLNCSLKSYDYSRFDNQVLDFGWPDHHSPPLNLLFQVCRAIHTWLEADPLNVVAVHCKAGKGRTGTVIASYLLYCQMFREYGEALNWFAEKRGAGVEMPSQIRYVKYMEDILERNSFPRRARYKLTRIMINGIPNIDGSGSFRPLVELYKENTELMFFAGSSKGFKSSPKRRSMKDGKLFSELSCSKELGLGLVKIVPEEEVELFGDILFVLKHIGFMGETRIGRFGFHTGFVHDGYIRFTHRDMDDAFKDPRFPDDFMVDIFLEEIGGSEFQLDFAQLTNLRNEALQAKDTVVLKSPDLGELFTRCASLSVVQRPSKVIQDRLGIQVDEEMTGDMESDGLASLPTAIDAPLTLNTSMFASEEEKEGSKRERTLSCSGVADKIISQFSELEQE